jgi:FtsH-binding integral membrane protein
VAVIKQNRPKGSVTAAVVSATALFGAVAAGAVSTTHALMAVLATSLFVTVFWADQASEGADYKQARTHLSLIAGLIAVAVAAFAYLAPAPTFTLGSFAGTVAAAMGLTAAGVYLTSFVSVRAKREGRRRSLEVSALIIAISILSQSGTALMVHDSQLVNAQTAALDISAK